MSAPTFSGRRHFLQQIALLGLSVAGARGQAMAATNASTSTIAAAWRGPAKSDPYFAGLLRANWDEKRLDIISETRLPTRPHGLLAESDGNLLVVGVRPGRWLMRVNALGEILTQVDISAEPGLCRLNGHAITAANSSTILTTETDFESGKGKIGVRDQKTLKKIATWDSHGLEPHQLLLDTQGHIFIANGGIPRDLADKKLDLSQMLSNLTRLDGLSGQLQQQWTIPDQRLSLRHLAWSTAKSGKNYLGIAIQAEHESKQARASAPILAVLADDELIVPETSGDTYGYAGDIAPAFSGGFAVSSNVSNVARVWHPGMPGKLTPIVELPEAYALTHWTGSSMGGVLVATAPGLVRWHPSDPAQFLAWPKPMALDNHWILVG